MFILESKNPGKKKKMILMMPSMQGLKKKHFLAWSCDRRGTGVGMV